jgi:hypothetical protein
MAQRLFSYTVHSIEAPVWHSWLDIFNLDAAFFDMTAGDTESPGPTMVLSPLVIKWTILSTSSKTHP